ncbi:CDP-diacylglycerol--glycerol-3-phosphate 3-phosphatidyltransferase [Corynebacterium aquatimens]|uniref:Phosphatidylinositol phosphate synthase n=2 Tax=Corynebacterium aquatimens TaxID=1190508 RepID=A0A931E0X7_9CORY|nr:CDP-diacylglycerol--glycerol-3-phosphate 3-phosphatidyltransferase [Corynebacterium aquatimens]
MRARKPAAVIVEPIAKAFLHVGFTPNTVTVLGTLATIGIAVTLIPSDHLLTAAILSALFAAFDLVDGTMARLRGGGTAFGATLDASCDRITDGALFGAIVFWLVYVDQAPPVTVVAGLIVLVLSQVISYVKARGEAGGLEINGGLVERAERLIIALFGLGLEGLGVPHAIEVALWLLAAGSLFTVVQRLVKASRSEGASATIAPPAGA